MMQRTFQEVNKRPTFKECCKELQQSLTDSGGKSAVRDIGILLHEGYTKKLSRSSSVVASSMRARTSGMTTKDLTSTSEQVLREVSEEDEDGSPGEHTRGDMGSDVTKNESGADAFTSRSFASTGSAGAASKPTARQRWKAARVKLQCIIPLMTLHTMKNMVFDAETGRLKRIVDPRSLQDNDADEMKFSTNPFDSEDSDLDVDADLDNILEDEELDVTHSPAPLHPPAPHPPAPHPPAPMSPSPCNTSEHAVGFDPLPEQSPLVFASTDDDGDDDGENGDDDEERAARATDVDVDVDVDELEDDMAILQLMAERRERVCGGCVYSMQRHPVSLLACTAAYILLRVLFAASSGRTSSTK
jgi:hypothetical protein